MVGRLVISSAARWVMVIGCWGAVWPASAAGQGSLQPVGWDASVKLRDVVDRNPDPHVLEIDLVAKVAQVEVAPGQKVEAWTYDGGLPGPLIRLNVGDRLIVHFTNELPQPTTIHWHGVRVPIQMDGVPDISQPEMKRGDTFTYDFIVPDAGLFWYHPHVMSAAQVGFGLYGALLVEDPAESVGVADELTVVLSDIGFDRHGTLESPESGGPAGMVFGREGNHVLVNGREKGALTARAGAPQRWRIVNAAKSRYFLLDFEGQPFTTIGTDGGLQEYPVESESLVLGPGERVDTIVTPKGKPGEKLVLRSLLYNRGYGSIEYRSVEELMTVTLSDLPAHTAAFTAATKRAVAPLSKAAATEVKLDLTLEQTGDAKWEFGINSVPFWKAAPLLAKLGETQVWTVTNTTVWAHPFHLHGFFFQVLDEKGEPVHPMAWKDTVNVPMKETVRFIVKFDDREGTWMFHCHILDHAEGGLMGTVQVGAGTGDHTHRMKP